MKTYRKDNQTREVVTLVSHTCDLCGQSNDREDWASGHHDISDTTIRFETGCSYPEGGSGVKIEADLCPTCFREKLIPWLHSQGVVTEEKEWDW